MLETLIGFVLIGIVVLMLFRTIDSSKTQGNFTPVNNLLEHFRTTLNKINSTAFIIDIDTAKLLFVNQYAKSKLGYSDGDLLDKDIDVITVDGVENSLREHCRQLLENKDDCLFFDTMLRAQSGSGLAFEAFLQSVSPQEDSKHFIVAIMRELEEKKRIEKLQHELISTVSHELRTPLTSIKGSLGLLSKEDLENMPEKTRFLIDVAQKNSDRLMYLINDILDLEKIRHFDGNFEKTEFDIVECLRETVETMVPYAENCEVTLILDNFSGEVIVNADRIRIEQVINNLLSNAIKSSPKKGFVHINVQYLKSRVRINVVDEGKGIPKSMQNRVFAPFGQLDDEEKNRLGTGLGLPIAKAIIEGHDGTIDFESQLSAGTRFYFDLPVVTTHLEQKSKKLSTETED